MARKQLVVTQGDKYGRLTIIKEVDSRIYSNKVHRRFLCICECGIIKEIDLAPLRRGLTISCGCHKKQVMKVVSKKYSTTHGNYQHPLYSTYNGMKQRCYYKKSKGYEDYGGRGIKVCDRWLESFNNFLEDMGDKPVGYTIDRINNDGNYESSNCRWASYEEQNNNRRTTKQKEVTLELRMQK